MGEIKLLLLNRDLVKATLLARASWRVGLLFVAIERVSCII